MTPLETFIAQLIAFAVGQTITDVLSALPQIRTAWADAQETQIINAQPNQALNAQFDSAVQADIAAGKVVLAPK